MTQEFNTQPEVSADFVLFCYIMLNDNPINHSQESIDETWGVYIKESADDYSDGDEENVLRMMGWDAPRKTWVVDFYDRYFAQHLG